MLEQDPEIDAVVVPIGGGGLIGGIACAIKETNPKVQIIGVQTAALPSMKSAVAEGKPVTLPALPPLPTASPCGAPATHSAAGSEIRGRNRYRR